MKEKIYFLKAYKEAKKLSNCEIILGDLPNGLTLSLILKSLSILQKIKLVNVVCLSLKIEIENHG